MKNHRSQHVWGGKRRGLEACAGLNAFFVLEVCNDFQPSKDSFAFSFCVEKSFMPSY
jgi:hypothetical protein